MEDSNILWKNAQEFENAYKYSEAATAYIKAAKIDLKNDKKKDAATEFGNAGTCLYYIGELDEALKYYREALAIDEQLGDLKGKATMLNNIGSILGARGELDEALKHYRESLEIDEQLGDLKGKATSLNNIGSILYGRGELDEALKHYREALEINEQLGDLKERAAILNNIGSILEDRGELDEALKHFREALEIDEQLGDLKGKATILNNIGLLLKNRGELDEALKHYREALEIDVQLGDLKGKAIRLNNIGSILYGRGELDEALKHYREALNLIQIQIKGKELDFKLGRIFCPNCKKNIEIKFMGESGAVIETCPFCGVQFSFWMVDPNSSKCLISILSEEDLQQGKITADRINLREQAGKETQTTISEWLQSGAIYTSNIASCYEKKGDFLNACNYSFQAASMFMGLGFFETANNELKSLESLLPEILENDREKYLHEIARLRKKTSKSLRSREFTYIFVSCPNCNSEHQIRASATIIAIELCSKCRARFSVFYDDDTQEFYTNLLEKPKVKVAIQKKGIERDEVRFCVRCGLNVGTVVQFCVRCGLTILRI